MRMHARSPAVPAPPSVIWKEYPADMSQQLLLAACEQAERSETAVRAAALMHIARVVARSDQTAAAARGIDSAAPAPTAGIAASTTAAALLLGFVLIHFDLMQRLVQLLAGLSEILQQLHLVIEVDNERLVFVFAQYVFKERVAGGALRVDNVALAAAGIHQQPEGQRQIRFAGEIADDLRPAVFLEDEVVLVEVGDDMAILIAHSREQIHHVDVRGEGGALLAGWSALLSDQQRSEEHTSELQSLRHLVC